jgi:hypothetical protein
MYLLASGNESQPVGQPAAALVFVVVPEPANAGTAMAPAGSAANAVRIGLRMWKVV